MRWPRVVVPAHQPRMLQNVQNISRLAAFFRLIGPPTVTGPIEMTHTVTGPVPALEPERTLATEIQSLYWRASDYALQAEDARDELESQDPEEVRTLTAEGLRAHQELMDLLARQAESCELMRDQLEQHARLLEDAQALGMTDEEWRAVEARYAPEN